MRTGWKEGLEVECRVGGKIPADKDRGDLILILALSLGDLKQVTESL